MHFELQYVIFIWAKQNKTKQNKKKGGKKGMNKLCRNQLWTSNQVDFSNQIALSWY